MAKPELFITLPKDEQAEVIINCAAKLGIEPHIIEKDLWVCWALEKLFTMLNPLRMVFKGGTSLSKVYNAIYRFSEDIDITIDYRSFNNQLQDPFAEGVSRTARAKLSDNLRNQLRDYVQNTVKPYFEEAAKTIFNNEIIITVDPTGEKFSIKYTSVMPNMYLKDGVLLEFGACNVTTPNQSHIINTLLSKFITNKTISFPSIAVPVLSPLRTFWEKATLIHVECSKVKTPSTVGFKASADRYSRHWYDLAMLSKQEIGRSAIKDFNLLQEVIKHKKVFFNGANYNYDACLQGEFCLVPNDQDIIELERDYKAMVDNGMFFVKPPSFREIIDELQKLEELINVEALVT